ncbi:MAG: hypothetical protein WC007_02850 [Pelobacteraceae bacterium]
MNDYVCTPPFISQSVPPLVMFEMGRDHKLYYQAYNEAVDLDDDGKIDYTYKHSINYYGYFDPYKCYTHTGGATGSSANTAQFTPVSYTANKFCSVGEWSGNVLNWVTMSRMDALKKVLYGGQRTTDSNTQTVLKRVYVPQDAHSWGKELTGRLCFDGTSTYTTTCSTDADCDTGNTCEDKSANLIGIVAADAPSECASSVTAPTWAATNKTKTNTTGNILIAKYAHPGFSGTATEDGNYTITTNPPPADCPSCPDQLVISNGVYDSFQPSSANFLDYYYISSFNYADTTAGCAATSTCKDVLPTLDHGDYHNFLAISEFNVTNANKGDWQFFIDSDDAAELLIAPSSTPSTPPTLVARHQIYDAAASSGNLQVWNGLHSSCASAPGATCDSGQIGTINLGSSGYYRLIVRHTEKTGQDGIRVWYRKGTSGSWRMFGENGVGAGGVAPNTWLASDLTLRAPVITTTNKCSIYSPMVVDYGAPVVGTEKRHLFCNTTLSAGGTPIMRLLKNNTNRMWQWAAKEQPVCDTSLGTPIDYTVQVEVCKSGIGTLSDTYEYERCKNYAGSYKPIGLLQKYGEQSGASMVCSKSMSKPCNTDSDCTLATDGLCVYKSDMYFGMFSTSYDKNKSGGVLHKNIGSILDETNANNGIFQTSENVSGNIIITMDKMKILDYNYSSRSYGTAANPCGWITSRPMNEGECRDWGNPIAEMMYESLRYLAGKETATTAFTNGAATDAGLLKQPAWGKFGTGSATYKPYDIYPTCAKPFILLLSDVNTAFDSDQVPGTSFGSYAEDGALPTLNMNVTTLANTIGTDEGIAGQNWFIGETSTLNNFICDSKAVTNLSLLRGLCPEEPTKQGSFYSAAVAYYGKTLFKANTALPDVNTFAVALASPFNDLKIKVGNKFVTLVPAGKSVSGCLGVKAACADKCTLTKTANGMTISACSSSAYCPTNTIVNVYVENIKYDASGNVIYAKFRINYEDVEQGADHDMDAIVSYEVCTDASENMSGTSCTTSLAADQLEVKVTSVSAAGCIDQVMGFVINGTTADATYLVVKDSDVGAGDADSPAASVGAMPLSWQKTFTVSATGTTTGLLKNPLWYAAKWGGFQDKNSNKKPDQTSEWDKDGDGDPDNYFMVVNPLQLERQLDRALNEILARVASGTAASILNNSEGSGANLLQAVFYPFKQFENSTSVAWTGEVQNLWYYVDPFIGGSTIREDTDYTTADPLPTPNPVHFLDLGVDKRVQFFFDKDSNQTKVRRFNADGTFEEVFPDDPDKGVRSIWNAGRLLWKRDPSTRKVYTTINGTSLLNFDPANAATVSSLASYLQASGATAAATATIAQNTMKYTLGYDGVCRDASSPCASPSRNRTVTIRLRGGGTATNVWKLGDIVSSTPRLQGKQALGSYDDALPRGYFDTTYATFKNTANYANRGMAYLGANDGMLHAFKLGNLAPTKALSGTIATMSGQNLGKEEWGFIPRNTLPYLGYMMNPDYNHIFFVDGAVSMFDMSTIAATSDYWNGPKTDASWKSILIGSMGVGGATNISTSGCTTGTDAATCVKTPILDPADNTKGLGYSSYFALDITNQDFNTADDSLRSQPALLWEFSNPALGYSTSGPIMLRINAKTKTGSTYEHHPEKNGRWLAVFASGPTGPINTTTHQMKGTSNQNLKLFVVDAQKGPTAGNMWVIDTGIANAFAGSIKGSVVDFERNPALGMASGYYQDDALYISYTKKSAAGTWTDGGILRVVIPQDNDPDQLDLGNSITPIHLGGFDPAKHWIVSKVIEGVGANNVGTITSSVTKLQSGSNYLFFGSGRYFYPQDDMSSQRRLYMVKDSCYKENVTHPDGHASKWTIDDNPSAACHSTVLDLSSLDDRTAGAADTTVTNGWYINLDSGERVVTDTVALQNGAIFYTSFLPTGDVCSFGGTTYLWGIKYDTGYQLPASAKQGKALIQVSTGAFEEVDISKVLTDKAGRRSSAALELTGKSATEAPPIVSNAGLMPVKRIIQIQERAK